MTRAQEVAELLRQRIFKRELQPGSWIDEMKLAEAKRDIASGRKTDGYKKLRQVAMALKSIGGDILVDLGVVGFQAYRSARPGDTRLTINDNVSLDYSLLSRRG